MNSNVRNIKTILKNEQKFREVAKVAFDNVDKDNSGEIDTQELHKLMVELSRDFKILAPTEDDVKEMMEELDQDKSGKIQFSEFMVFFRNFMETLIENETE